VKHRYEIVEIRNAELTKPDITSYGILKRHGSRSRILTRQELNAKIDSYLLPRKLRVYLLGKGTALFETVQDTRAVTRLIEKQGLQLNTDKTYYRMEAFLCGFENLFLGDVETEDMCHSVARHFRIRLSKVGFWKKEVGTTYLYAAKIMLPHCPSVLMTCHELAHLLDVKERGTSKHDARFFNRVLKVLAFLSYRSGATKNVDKIVFRRDGTIRVEFKNRVKILFSGLKHS
jgi:hypothetical protein